MSRTFIEQDRRIEKPEANKLPVAADFEDDVPYAHSYRHMATTSFNLL